MIAVIDYNAGNVRSVHNALKRIGCDSVVTDEHSVILGAEKVILPGVGEASAAMNHLRSKKLDMLIKDLRQPVLGICLGLHLLCRSSEEGDTDCLGIFDCKVLRFPDTDRVPHMGWNNLIRTSGKLLNSADQGTDLYFVHSFYAEICSTTTATAEYILPFTAGMEKDNFFATQFHPEKSGPAGETILRNFIRL